MIGNKTNANIAVKIYPKVRNLPDGWRFLGKGVSRYVYLGPDGIAYKVGYKMSWSNKHEHENAKKLRRFKSLPGSLKVPKTSLHLGGRVLAMEYIEKSKTRRYNFNHYYNSYCRQGNCTLLRCPGKMEAIFSELGFDDFHPGNVIIDKNGDYWAIDLVG